MGGVVRSVGQTVGIVSKKANEAVQESVGNKPEEKTTTTATRTQEELNELFEAIESGDREEMKDAYGDILVTSKKTPPPPPPPPLECLKGAYEEIKDRKGYLSKEGLFIKQ